MTHPFSDHEGIYLLSHSVGLPVADTRSAIDGYLDTWQHHTPDAWPRWLAGIDGFRQAVARLISADAASVCPQSNVSSGLTKVLAAQRHRFSDPTVLVSEKAFPSLGFVCERSGYAVRFLPADADESDPDQWAAHAQGVDVAIVNHVYSNTGIAVSIDAVGSALRRQGVSVYVDVAQSAGVLAVDVDAWDVDVILGSCVKWLSGGAGAGWLWASPQVIESSVPIDVGWWSHEEPFEFDIHHYRDAADGRRFWGATPSVLPFVVAANSITQIDRLGVDTVRRHNHALVDLLVDELDDRVVSPHDPAQRSGTAVVAAGPDIVETLAEQGIHVDHRAQGIRVSPHVYTTANDVHRLIEVVARH